MINRILKKIRKHMEPPRVSFQRYQPFFKTIDGMEHEGVSYKWACREKLNCTIPEYLMTSIKCDGYAEDVNGLMYPLTNIISIEWKLLEEQTIKSFLPEYKVFYTSEEIKELGLK